MSTGSSLTADYYIIPSATTKAKKVEENENGMFTLWRNKFIFYIFQRKNKNWVTMETYKKWLVNFSLHDGSLYWSLFYLIIIFGKKTWITFKWIACNFKWISSNIIKWTKSSLN